MIQPRNEDPPEIEITPEMVEAGATALARYDQEFESREEAAARIFQAMLKQMRAVKTLVSPTTLGTASKPEARR